MKLCPNCEFENFKNPDNCDRCQNSISIIKDEKFQLFEFIKRNSAIYVVIGVLLAFVNYLSKPDNNFRTGASLVSALLAILLIFLLIIKAWKYSSYSTQNPSNNLEIFTYTFIHLFLIFSVFLFYDFTYLPIIALFIGLLLGFIVPSNIREQFKLRVSFLIFITCVTFLILVYLSTQFIWDIFPKTDLNSISYLIIASSIVFFSFGAAISSTIVIFLFTSLSNKKFKIFEVYEGLKQTEFGVNFQLLIGSLILLLIIFVPMFFK